MEPLLNDDTLVNGDVVSTPSGLKVFRGQATVPHSLADTPVAQVHVQPGSSSKARGRDSVEQPQAAPLVERRTLCRKRSTADHLNPAIRKPVAASSSRVEWATASAYSRQGRGGISALVAPLDRDSVLHQHGARCGRRACSRRRRPRRKRAPASAPN
jgi:hypothetical protein